MPYREITVEKIRWIHVHQPTPADLAFVRGVHAFDETVLDYLSSPTLHPSLEEFESYIFFILHFPIIYRSHKHNQSIEVDFLFTKEILITLTYERYDRLEALFRRCSRDSEIQAKHFHGNTGFLLYFIVNQLYQRMIKDRDYIEQAIDTLENKIFADPSHTRVEEIANLRRDILDFRRIFGTQGNILELLPRAVQHLLGKPSLGRFANLLVTQNRIQRLIDNHQETIDALQDSYQALVQSRTSRIIQTLTIFSAIMLPLSFVAGLWGMNQEFMPLRDGPYDFWLVLGLMVIVASAMFFIFRRFRWL